MTNLETRSTDKGFASSGIWRGLAWLGAVLQVAALVFVIWSQNWGGAWVIAGFLVLSVSFLAMQDRMPGVIDFIVVLAALLNAGGWAWEWYDALVWFDEFIHFFSSFAIMSAIGYLAWARGWTSAAPGTGRFILWTAAVGFGLGIAWEILESLFLNLAFLDTVVDLVMDTLGGAVAGWFLGRVTPERPSATAH